MPISWIQKIFFVPNPALVFLLDPVPDPDPYFEFESGMFSKAYWFLNFKFICSNRNQYLTEFEAKI